MLHEMENDRSENERADGEPTALESAIQGIIGYLNFSEGKPEPRFAQQVDQVFAWLQAMAPAEGGAIVGSRAIYTVASRGISSPRRYAPWPPIETLSEVQTEYRVQRRRA